MEYSNGFYYKSMERVHGISEGADVADELHCTIIYPSGVAQSFAVTMTAISSGQ